MRVRGPLLGLALAASALLVVLGWSLDRQPASRRLALSPQGCNTECQRRQTDCILACDGNVPCEKRCAEAGKACVERCRHAPDAGTEGREGQGGRGARLRPKP